MNLITSVGVKGSKRPSGAILFICLYKPPSLPRQVFSVYRFAPLQITSNRRITNVLRSLQGLFVAGT